MVNFLITRLSKDWGCLVLTKRKKANKDELKNKLKNIDLEPGNTKELDDNLCMTVEEMHSYKLKDNLTEKERRIEYLKVEQEELETYYEDSILKKFSVAKLDNKAATDIYYLIRAKFNIFGRLLTFDYATHSYNKKALFGIRLVMNILLFGMLSTLFTKSIIMIPIFVLTVTIITLRHIARLTSRKFYVLRKKQIEEELTNLGYYNKPK